MHEKEEISVWFFIGVLLLIYGILITAAGIYQTMHPAEQRTVLAELHSGVWWGAVILVLGVFYTYAFRPGKR
jgi:hypothetical protein